jgi:hypothetical protein
MTMKHIKEYSETELLDLDSDLSDVGLSDWMGFFVTVQLSSADGITAEAMGVVGNGFESIAQQIFKLFTFDGYFEDAGVDDLGINSLERIMEILEDFLTDDMSSTIQHFEYKSIRMRPKTLKNFCDSVPLLSVGGVLEMGRSTFSDFESKISGLK